VTSSAAPEFPGFPELRANVTFVPLQFFTAVLPHRSRGCVRLVGFMLRQLLGWVDADGNPTREQIQFSYRDLMEGAGISRDAIAEAVREALEHRLIRCVREPRPDRSGQGGQNGIYALRWSGDYTNDPQELTGFFRSEAIVVPAEERGRTGPTAKPARKNIPNAFFDHVLRRERLSVARVVGTLLFKSIQWTDQGERKVPVCLSITELCRLTHLGRRHVHEALQEARQRGYLERVQEGRFDPNAGLRSHAATYRIRWTAQSVNPVYVMPANPADAAAHVEMVPYPFLDRSEKGYGKAVGKGARDQSEKGNGDRSEKGNDLSIKRSFNKQPTAAGEPSAVHPSTAAAAEGLMEVGFDLATARQLAKQHAPEIIAQQLQWLPLRRTSTNKLGLLRRAIEQNWPKPEGGVEADPPGAIFVRHYAAAFHRQTESLIPCSPREAAHAIEFLRRLDPQPTEAQAAEWGRRFGAFARGRKPAKPWLVWVLRMHGDEFVQQHRQAANQARRVSVADSHRVHEEHFAPAYLAHLREIEARCRAEQPALYAAFVAHREETGAQLKLSEKSRALLASETSRLCTFADFACERGLKVPTFWEWDRQGNPHPWSDPAASPS